MLGPTFPPVCEKLVKSFTKSIRTTASGYTLPREAGRSLVKPAAPSCGPSFPHVARPSLVRVRCPSRSPHRPSYGSTLPHVGHRELVSHLRSHM